MIRPCAAFRPLLTTLICGIFFLLLNVSLWASTLTTIGKETLKKAVMTYIEDTMPWPPNTVRIEFLSDVSDIKVPGEGVSYRVSSRRNEDYVGYSNFTVSFYHHKVLLEEKTIRVRLQVLRKVIVSSRYLSRGTEITSDDIDVNERWFTRLPLNTISDPREVVGKTLSASVRKNSEIHRNMLKEPVMVKRGKLIRIMVERGALTITTLGIAEQNGACGDVIKVKNLESQRVVYATVTGDSTARVQF